MNDGIKGPLNCILRQQQRRGDSHFNRFCAQRAKSADIRRRRPGEAHLLLELVAVLVRDKHHTAHVAVGGERGVLEYHGGLQKRIQPHAPTSAWHGPSDDRKHGHLSSVRSIRRASDILQNASKTTRAIRLAQDEQARRY
eukprot:3305390-Pyramimonas_sp.AAC.1